MTCALTADQVRNLRRYVHKTLLDSKERNVPFSVKEFSSSLYADILKKTGDSERALAFVQQVPDQILAIAGVIRDIRSHLIKTGQSLDAINNLSDSFRDSDKGPENIQKYLGIGADFAKQAEQTIEAKQDSKDAVVAEAPETQAPLEDQEDSSKPDTVFITHHQTSRRLKSSELAKISSPEAFEIRNQIDADKKFIDDNVKRITKAVAQADGDGSKAKIGDHTGFKLTLIPATVFPEDQLTEENKQDKIQHEGKPIWNNWIYAAVTDNDGNLLYFSPEGAISKEPSGGKVVYVTIREVKSHPDTGEKSLLRWNRKLGRTEDALVSPTRIVEKERIAAAKEGVIWTKEQIQERLEQVKQQRQEDIKQLDDLRKFVLANPQSKVTVDITGGTIGVEAGLKGWHQISESISDNDIRTLQIDKTKGKGVATIQIEGVSGRRRLDRPKITDIPGLAEKIASILTMPIEVDGEPLTNRDKADYVNQFLIPNRSGNDGYASLIHVYVDDENNLKVTIGHRDSSNWNHITWDEPLQLPSPEKSEDENTSLTDSAYPSILQALSEVHWSGGAVRPTYININNDLVNKTYTEYNLTGLSATKQELPYVDFIRKNVKVDIQSTDKLGPQQINAYLTYSVPVDVMSKVLEEEQKPEVKELTPEQKVAPDPHSGTLTDLTKGLEGLLKIKGLDSSAASEQIAAAKKWFDNHPISKHIPFQALFNIVNSDAVGKWTSSGITLYAGSNYTDLYHESWHGFTQLFLTRDQKRSLYDEAGKLSGSFTNPDGSKTSFKNATDFQLEEFLAEDFRKYAMSGGKKVLGGRPARNNIFRRIWNFLKQLFSGSTVKDIISGATAVKNIKDIYDNLYKGELNKYSYSLSNVQFGVLNKSVEPLVPAGEIPGWEGDQFSLEESRLLSDSIDSIISSVIDKANSASGTTKATELAISDPKWLPKVYGIVKQDFEAKKQYFLNQAESEPNSFVKSQLIQKASLLDKAIRNFGNPDEVLHRKEDKGVIYYHQQKTKFIDVSQKIYDATDEESEDGLMSRHDRSGNEYSLEQLAADEILYVVKSLHKIQGGAKVFNNLGYPELVDSALVIKKLADICHDSPTREEMFSKLKASIPNFPEISQLLQKIGSPEADLTNKEFLFSEKFFQVFRLPIIRLQQLTINKSLDEQGNSFFPSMTVGEASSNNFKVIRQWEDRFNTSSPEVNPYIYQDSRLSNYLDTKKIVSKFLDKNGRLKENQEYDFLKAIGFDFDQDTPEMRRELVERSGSFGIPYIVEAISTVNREILKGNEESPIYQEAIKFTKNPIQALRMGHPGLQLKDNSRRVNLLAEFHTKNSDSTYNFSVLTAENNQQYLLSLHNSMSKVITSLNAAPNYQSIVDPETDTEGKFKQLRFLDMSENPLAKSSYWLSHMFDLERLKPDETYNENFGERKKQTTETGSPNVGVNLYNVSGVQVSVNQSYPETGVSMSGADGITKFLADIHMMLLGGKMEVPRHEAKSTAFGMAVSDTQLYIPANLFLSYSSKPEDAGKYDGFGKAFPIIAKYIQAELEVIKKVNSNLEYYKKLSGFNRKMSDGTIAGQNFQCFDDVLSQRTKDILLTLKTPLDQALKDNLDLRQRLQNEVKAYFDNQVEKNLERLQRAEYIHNNALDKIATKRSDEDRKLAAIRAFTYNAWIHNFESLILVYQSPAQYNHAKEEFNKRNSMFGSTGKSFDTGVNAQKQINTKVGYSYAESLGIKRSSGYDGTMNTAVLADSISDSVYYKEYVDYFTKYYNDLYSNRKDMSSSDIKKIVSTKIASLSKYLGMKDGDAQGWITLDSYRILSYLEGNWSDKQEKLFQKIIKKQPTSDSDVTEAFPVKKLQYAGVLATLTPTGKQNGLPVVAGHKFSLVPLVPGTFEEGSNMGILNKMMMSQGIDYALFASGSKISTITSTGSPDQLYSDLATRQLDQSLKFTKNPIFVDYLKNQLEVSPEFKDRVTFSTQLRKLIEQPFYNEGAPVDFVPGAVTSAEKLKRVSQWNSLSEQQKREKSPVYVIARSYEENLKKLQEVKRQQLLDEAGWTQDKDGNPRGNLKDLMSLVKKDMSRQDIADHLIDFIKVDQNGSLVYPLDLHTNAEKIERLLTAMVNNRLIRQKVHGEALVQVSSALTENQGRFTNATKEQIQNYRGTIDLPTYHQTESGKTSAMKVMIALRGDYLNLLKLSHNDESPISTIDRLNEMIKDESWLNKDNNRKAITLVGVRIPVQGPNSMEFMEVHHFLPATAGTIIIPPAEIVAKSGSDFDVDKLSVFTASIGRNGEYLTHDFQNREEVEAQIEKVRSEKANVIAESLNELEKLKASNKTIDSLSSSEVKKVEEGMEVANAQKDYFLETIRSAIQDLQATDRVPGTLVDAAQSSDSSLIKELEKISQTKYGLDSIDPRIAGAYRGLKSLGIEKLDDLYNQQQAKLAADTDYQNRITKIKQEIREKSAPFKRELSKLSEIRRRFVNTIENRIIEDIRNILEHPVTYRDLIQPNDTDIIEQVVGDEDDPTALGSLNRDYNPRENFIAPVPAKGISPTRIMEVGYNLYKHTSNNIYKKSLGIAAVNNTFHTLFTIVGAYLDKSYEWVSSTGKQAHERTINIRMPHNKVGDKISMSGIYDAEGVNKISDVLSQLINILVDVGKDARLASSLPADPERLPMLILLVRSGVSLKQASWFLSSPLIKEYVNEQRLAKSTFSGPLGKAPDNPNYFRIKAKSEILEKYFPDQDLTFTPEGAKYSIPLGKKMYEATTSILNSVLGSGDFAQEDLENLVEGKSPKDSDLSKAVFLHYLELEDMFDGVRQLQFTLNYDTKKSTTLYDAQARLQKLENLRKNSRIPSEIVDKILEETPIGNFLVQDLQLKLWSNLFPLRSNPTVTNFISKKLKSMNTKEDVQNTFRDEEKFVAEFKNSLVSFLFQNSLRDFNLGSVGSYKSISASTEVPVKYVDLLDHGAFVKEDESGKPTLYIDPKQLRKDFETKAYVPGKKGSYEDNKFARLDPSAFSFTNDASDKEYYHFVVEREYLRYANPFSEFKKTESFQERLSQQGLKSGENPEFERELYEEMLRDKALDNVFNPWKLFQSQESSVPTEFLKIMQRYPELKKEYSLLSQLEVSVYQKKGQEGVSNIILRDTSLNADKINRYHENLVKLSDPSIQKVQDTEENKRISEFFSRLPLFSFMQSGLSKGSSTFTSVIPSDPLVRVMAEPLGNFVSNVLSSPKSEELLERVYDRFVNVNSVSNRKMRRRFQNYLLNNTPEEMYRESEAPEAATVVRRTYNELQPTKQDGIFTYSDRTLKLARKKVQGVLVDVQELSNKKTQDYSLMSKANPQVAFVYNDNESDRKLGLSGTGLQRDLAQYGGFPILTGSSRSKGFEDVKTPEQIKQVKDSIENDIQNLIALRDAGKSLAFSESGYGRRGQMPEEIYDYLSQRLYEEFGYLNPSAIHIPIVRNILEKQQGISDKEIEELKRNCVA